MARATEPVAGPKRLHLQNGPAVHDGESTITLRGASLNAIPEGIANVNGAPSSMQQGLEGTLDQLAGHLANAS